MNHTGKGTYIAGKITVEGCTVVLFIRRQESHLVRLQVHSSAPPPVEIQLLVAMLKKESGLLLIL